MVFSRGIQWNPVNGMHWFYPIYHIMQWDPGGFCGCSEFYGPKSDKSDIRSQFIRGSADILKIVHVMCVWMNWSEVNRIDGWMDEWTNEQTNGKKMILYVYTSLYIQKNHPIFHPIPCSIHPLLLKYSLLWQMLPFCWQDLPWQQNPWGRLSGVFSRKPTGDIPAVFCWKLYSKKHFQNIRFVGGIIHIPWMYMKPIFLVLEPGCEIWVRIYQFCFHLQYPVPCT